MNKVVRDGKVAVLYSPAYGAGWYSWNLQHPECLFHPEIIALVETGKTPSSDLCNLLFGNDFYPGGARDLEIEWITEGTQIQITEYDGLESILYRDKDDGWVTV